MSTLSDLLAEHTGVPGEVADHLQRVVAEWQLLSDLSFADFLLWVPISTEATSDNTADSKALDRSFPGQEAVPDQQFLCVAQARPTTAPTAHPEDLVSTIVHSSEHHQLRRAVVEGRICREEDPLWHLGIPVRRETIPVRFSGGVVAVLSRDTNLATPRVPSPLEISYLGSAADLCQMIADGTFPTAEPAADVHTSPRVGDGLLRVDSGGAVVFASPNALSAYHRMGHAADLVGTELAPLTRSLLSDPFDAEEVAARIRRALDGQPSMRMEADARGATVLFRALPLRPHGQSAGALLLVRDVTEVKRRDRALLSKDATIREIHHRVKNNLQTVAALLRMQSRRTGSSEAQVALQESVRRVTSIALVHETLSLSVDERVDLDDVLDRVIPMMSDVAATETGIKIRREGRFGVVAAELATPLVMVLTELVQNAFEHAFPPGQGGEVVVQAQRSARWLDAVISDNGRGLPPGFSLERTERLGLHIVRTLVESELQGSLSIRGRDSSAAGDDPGKGSDSTADFGSRSGTEAVLRVPLKSRRS